MDGFPTKIGQSLQYRLSIWLSLCILSVAVVGGLFSFQNALREANEFQDDQLKQIAALIDYRHLPLKPKDRQYVTLKDIESRVIVQMLHSEGHPVSGSASDALVLSADLPDGVQTISVSNTQWRVFVKTIEKGSRLAISQQTLGRDEIAQDSAWRTLMPLMILIPLLIALIGILIVKMFKPVRKLALELDSRSEHQLGALSEAHLPLEILPFVVAINRLLKRVAQSVEIQRRFVADAAHELRTPLTALSLQAERLSRAEMSTAAHDRLAAVRQAILRTRLLVDQLLALARVQQPAGHEDAPISIMLVIRQTLEDLMPLAERKNIDLGVTDGFDASVAVSHIDLTTMIRNLIDNAIRYSPEHGSIDLEITKTDTVASLIIRDTGPGIAAHERERVFDAFYRVLGSDELGSGLGLSIVKTIADRIGATVALTDTNDTIPYGLTVTVTFRTSAGSPSSSVKHRL